MVNLYSSSEKLKSKPNIFTFVIDFPSSLYSSGWHRQQCGHCNPWFDRMAIHRFNEENVRSQLLGNCSCYQSHVAIIKKVTWSNR